ncbi:Formamidopyrimidine-DNA glycosylase [Rubrivivax sp. A210]|uniref:bifunctional DNA-formamidopyrimidine glycosylase/DNA-(apurinic or apyrimidinic site) lyase n=1 Tax=Rubrivivax sp. A210 TaxID=2772301 RepID=UPI001918336A|nr:bifunctional DNA-formamidopyrimidine glycosylase/DNA-(apurinic or apyrimidinic site) lyase [Rubrivivax sp. A210]CAD5372125.1 Formamidopyrimidine-DNA glycosylase [Rubrivivax sp. A210]
MPELPEVEVTRRGIAGPLLGAKVLALRLGKPLRWPLGREPQALAGAAVGAVVGEVARRGKYLWLPLLHADAASDGGLLLHLGMSGSLALLDAPPPPGPHDHFDLVTDRGTLRLNDPRRFGAVLWSAALDVPPAATLLARLGPEPFDAALTDAGFHAALQLRSAPIKAVLLAGEVVVGAGNIYACEALHAAAIHPALRADRISRPRAARLLAALRATLARALELGGSTLRDFSDVHGAAGTFQAVAAVYGRAGLPCLRCGGTVQRRVQAQRSTYFCAGCQRR